MTTPKQDLTVEQIENFRSYCHAYLEKIGPTHTLIDRVCGLALKGSEAQKPEPSITRQELDDDARQPGGPLSRVPSPTPGDKDVEEEEFVERHYEAITIGGNTYPAPSGSVDEGWLQDREADLRQPMGMSSTDSRTRLAEAIRLIRKQNEALKRMEEQYSFKNKAFRRACEKLAEVKGERDRLSLEVGRLKKVAEDYIRELTTATQNAAACASLSITSSAHIEARVRLEQLETKLRDARNALAGGVEK